MTCTSSGTISCDGETPRPRRPGRARRAGPSSAGTGSAACRRCPPTAAGRNSGRRAGAAPAVRARRGRGASARVENDSMAGSDVRRRRVVALAGRTPRSTPPRRSSGAAASSSATRSSPRVQRCTSGANGRAVARRVEAADEGGRRAAPSPPAAARPTAARWPRGRTRAPPRRSRRPPGRRGLGIAADDVDPGPLRRCAPARGCTPAYRRVEGGLQTAAPGRRADGCLDAHARAAAGRRPPAPGHLRRSRRPSRPPTMVAATAPRSVQPSNGELRDSDRDRDTSTVVGRRRARRW